MDLINSHNVSSSEQADWDILRLVDSCLVELLGLLVEVSISNDGWGHLGLDLSESRVLRWDDSHGASAAREHASKI